MKNEESVLQADDIPAPADKQIIRNLGCLTPGTPLISALLKNKSSLSVFTHWTHLRMIATYWMISSRNQKHAQHGGQANNGESRISLP